MESFSFARKTNKLFMESNNPIMRQFSVTAFSSKAIHHLIRSVMHARVITLKLGIVLYSREYICF